MQNLNSEIRTAIFFSSRGSTLCEVIRANKNGYLGQVKLAVAITNNPKAGGIESAMKLGFPQENIVKIIPKDFETPEAYGAAILHELKLRGVDLIAQLGFLPTMPSNVVAAYLMSSFNQHPGPLDQGRPDFGGKYMYGRAVHESVIRFSILVPRFRMTEATTHRITDAIDGGAILGRKFVEIWNNDTAETLADRLLPFEYGVVLKTFRDFCEPGGPKEIHREEPLIRNADELAKLKEAKDYGIAAAKAVEKSTH